MANPNAGTPMQRLEAKLDGVTSTEDKIKALDVLTVESIIKMGVPELKKVARLVDFDPANHTKTSLLAVIIGLKMSAGRSQPGSVVGDKQALKQMKLVHQSRGVTATGAQRNPPRSRTSAGSNGGPVGTF